MFKGIIKGESVRRLRLSSSQEIFNESINHFHSFLIDSGWNRTFVKSVRIPDWNDRLLLLNKEAASPCASQGKQVFFPLSFSPLNKEGDITTEVLALCKAFGPKRTKISRATKVSSRLRSLIAKSKKED